eukprot:UN19012
MVGFNKTFKDGSFLEGTIPSTFPTDLKYLNLAQNRLIGRIPSKKITNYR